MSRDEHARTDFGEDVRRAQSGVDGEGACGTPDQVALLRRTASPSCGSSEVGECQEHDKHHRAMEIVHRDVAVREIGEQLIVHQRPPRDVEVVNVRSCQCDAEDAQGGSTERPGPSAGRESALSFR